MPSGGQPTVAEPAAKPAAAVRPRRPATATPAASPTVEPRLLRPSAVPLAPADAAALLATRQLVQALAPLLGLDPAAVRITPGPQTAAGPGVVHLDTSERLPPSLLVHELAHVRQHENRHRSATAPDATAAEAEAAALATAARVGDRLWTPRAVLPEGRLARDVDASGVTPTPQPPDTAALAAQLVELVRSTRAAEISRIRDSFSGFFTLTSEGIEAALDVLGGLDFVTARAVVGALDRETRVRMAHLDDGHHQRHPGAAVAVLSALTQTEASSLVSVAQPGTVQRSPVLQGAVQGLDATRLTAIELRAAIGALRRVPEATLVRLTRGSRREAFRALLSTPAPPGTDLDALQAAIRHESATARAADDEIARTVVQRLRRVLVSSSFVQVHLALEILAPLAAATAPTAAAPPPASVAPAEAGEARPAGPTLPPPAAPARATAAGTNAPPTPTERLRAIVAALDQAGLFNRMLEGLPEEERYAGPYSVTLKLLLAARSPALLLPRIEELLSYDFWSFNWVITDSDARYAYLLVRSLPLEVQDAWRVRDDGKWFQRLQDNMPGELIRNGEYTGVGSEFRVGGFDLPGLDQAPVRDLLDNVLRIWGRSRNGANARAIVRLLLALDRPEPDRARDMLVRTSVVRRLDALGQLDAIYGELPNEYLFGEQGRQELLGLTEMRDPVHVEQRAASLLSTGFWDWWVSSKDAWLAYQLLRALPPETQQRFQAADPGRWSTMLNAMTAEMRSSLATSAATGRGAFPGRAALRERLRDPMLWNASHVWELRALMVLARASDDAEFVFQQSRERNAYRIAGLGRLVADLELYDPRVPPERTVFHPEDIEPLGVGTELFRFVDRELGVRWILVGIGAWLFMDWVRIGGRSIQVRDFDLTWAQWAMGGDLAGARLAQRPESGGPDRPGPGAPSVDANRVSMEADLGTGAVRLRLPELNLESLNIVRGGASYRTGPLLLRNLRVQADFSDRHYREPVGVELAADRLSVDDLALADPRLLNGAWGLGHLLMRPIHLKAGATGDEDLAAHPPREGTIPIPIFGPLFQALSNIVAIRGGIPFNWTLVDLALLPATSGMSFLQSAAITTPANAIFPTARPLDYVWGLATDGVLRPPRTAAARISDAIDMLRSWEVQFDELRIDGLSIGAGEQVSSLVLRDVAIGVAQSRPAYLRLLISSLERARGAATGTDRAAIEDRIREAQAELDGTARQPGLEAAERELEELERRDRWEPGSLNETERRRLTELSDLVRRDTGAIVDIGGIEIGALTGRVEAAGARVSGIHLEGRLPLNTAGYLADEELAARFVRGGPRAPTVRELVAGGDVRLTIDSAELVPGPAGEPALRVNADRVPTEQELVDRLARMPAGADPILRTRFQEALDLVRELGRLRDSDPRGVDPSVQDRIVGLTRLVRQKLGLEVGSLSLGRITGGLDPTTGALTATVHDVDARDLRGDGFAVRRVSGDVTLGLSGLAGLGADYRTITGDAALRDARTSLTAHFGLNVTAEGIVTEAGTVGEATIEGLHGDVGMLADGFRVSNLWATRIGVRDVNLGVAGARITARGATLEGLSLDAEVHLATEGERRRLTSAVVSRLDVNRIAADTLVYDTTDPETGSTIHVEILGGALGGIRTRDIRFAEDADGTPSITAGGSISGIQDLRYRVVLGTLDSASRTLKETTVTGTLQGGTMPATASGAPEPAGAATTVGPAPVLTASLVSSRAGRQFSLGVNDLDVLGTEVRTPDGSVFIRHVRATAAVEGTATGQSVSARLTNLEISRLDWRAGTARITSDSRVRFDALDVRGRREEADPASSDPERRHGRILVEDLDLRGLDVAGLRYRDPPIDLRLGRTGVTHPGALHIRRIRLQNFSLPYQADGTTGPPTSGRLDVTGAHVDFVGTVARGIRTRGELNARSISVDIFRGDTFVARMRGVGGDVDLDMDGLHTHVVLDDLDTGTVTVTPDALVVRGLHIASVALDELRVSSTGDPPFNLSTYDAGSIYVTGIDMTARLERWRPGERHPPDQPFRRAVVERFEIQRIEAEGLELMLPRDGVVIRVPVLGPTATGGPPPLATLRNVVLAGSRPGESFEWVPGATGFVRGVARLDELAVPRLEADIAGRFHGNLDLHTDAASIELLQRGGTVVDIRNPRARMTDPAWLDRRDRTIFFEEAGAERVHVEAGEVAVTGAHVERLRYEQPGIEIDVRRIATPGVVRATATRGTIPELRIDDAHLRVSFGALASSGGTSGASGGGGSSLPIDRALINRLIDHLQGDLSFAVFLRVELPALDDRDIRIPVRLHFTDGRIDYQELQRSLQGVIESEVADEPPDDRTLRGRAASTAVDALASRPEFRYENGYLYFALHLLDLPSGPDSNEPPVPVLHDIARWHIPSDEFVQVTMQHRVRLARLAEPAPLPGSGGGGSESDAMLRSMEFQDIDADLSIRSDAPIPLPIASPSLRGRIVMSPNALIHLRAGGYIPASIRPRARRSLPGLGGVRAISMDELNFDSVDLTAGNTRLTTGSIEIRNLHDGRLDMWAVYPPQPRIFEAAITSAVARNIQWNLRP